MYRILILEDDDDLRPLLVDVLQEEGFQVDSCSAGDEAIAFARGQEYDLMVADIRMEGLDGLSALSQVQSYRPGVDALVISGYADAEQAERASRLGLGAVLKKPFQLDLFLHKVNALLRSRSQRRGVQVAFETLLSTSRWSLQHLARFLDGQADKKYHFHQLLDICGLICSELNLLGSHLEKVKAGALAAAWQQSAKSSELEPPIDLPEHFHSWSECLGEWWNGSGPKGLQGTDIPLESRVIVLALAFSLIERAQDVDSRWPGRFDPTFLSILDRNLKIAEVAPTSREHFAEASTASLLDLARTLMRQGEFGHASAALQDVVQRDAESREGVEALLLLARLKQRAGLVEEARQMAFRTPELAKSFGPGLAAHAYLQSGRLLLDLNELSQATVVLDRAQQFYRALGLEASAAECGLLAALASGTLASSTETEASLGRLLTPQHRAQLVPCARHLIRALLAEESLSESLQRCLARLILAHPQTAKVVLATAPEPSQRSTLELINKAGPLRYQDLLRTLGDSKYREVQRVARELAAGDSQDCGSLPLNVSTLGRLVAEVGDQQVPDRSWKTNKVRYLFARLVDAYPNPIHEDVLIEEFWPDNPEKGRRSLYTATSSIRSALRKAGLQSKDLVEKALNGLKLADDIELNYDLANLRAMLKEAREFDKAGELDSAVVAYRRAVLEFEEQYLPNCFYDWALNLRQDLESQLLQACIRLTEVSFKLERLEEVLEFARRALKYDSANETATGLLLSALLKVGRPAEALKRYNSFCEILKEELGISEVSSIEQVISRAVGSARV